MLTAALRSFIVPVRMATFLDIVRESGLARTTVAEILRNKPGYNNKTRQRVLQVARRLGYRPNYLSKALRGGQSMTIGLIMPTLETALFNQRVHAIETVASDHGYVCYLCGYLGNLQRSVRDLLDRRVDGVVFHVDASIIRDLGELTDQLPAATVWIGDAPQDATSVLVIDKESAILQLTAHLAEQGYRSAAFLKSSYHARHPRLRSNWLISACQACGIDWWDGPQWTLPPGHHNATTVMQYLRPHLHAGLRLPDVLLATNDDCAMGVLAALREVGLRVPDDVGVVGFDGLPFAAAASPSLSTVRAPGDEVGLAAFTMLQQLISRPDEPVNPVVLSCQFVARQSTTRRPVPGTVTQE